MTLAPTLEAFAAALPASGALLGLDPGTKTIGVAVCDERRSLASPLETLFRGKMAEDLAQLGRHAARRRACGVVIGLPLHMHGGAGRRAQSVRAFSRHVEDALALPVFHQDERLSTFAAEEAMAAAGLRPADRAAIVDAHAAAYILQTAIDRLANLSGRA